MEAPLRQVIAGVYPGCALRATKVLQFENQEDAFDVRCRIDLAPKGSAPPGFESSGPAQFTVGLEMVINLLAPNVPDRSIEFGAARKPLEWSGVVDGPRVRLVDEWQDVAVEIEARGASQLLDLADRNRFRNPEEGFERVYQGSQILGVWNVDLSSAEPWSAETVLHVSAARSA